MADPKQEETFKVIDRRLFSEDGALRKDVVEEEERREDEAAARAANRAASNPPPQTEANKAPKAPAANSGATAPASPASGDNQQNLEAEPQGSRSFQMLVDFLVRNAAAMLGGMADPRTGQAYLDLEGAREVIDMLDALRDKTRGNLSKADDDLLIEVLGQLKLTFMEMSKVAAEAMAKKAAQKK
ncbi:MAG TPA: DUF1844 domain-containing protein [Candidatus Acidoferrales bacterium]|nr:DUF1844 domain-containing protein [Candidatus Acidoferrales bacterium]